MALWKYHSCTKLPSNHIKQASLDPNHNLVYHPDPEHGLLRISNYVSGRVLVDSYLCEISSKSKLSVSLDGMGIWYVFVHCQPIVYSDASGEMLWLTDISLLQQLLEVPSPIAKSHL